MENIGRAHSNFEIWGENIQNFSEMSENVRRPKTEELYESINK